jgi:outer membrane protein assembly factor BamB
VAWKSEALIPAGYYEGQPFGNRNIKIQGGHASPIVDGGQVYLWFFIGNPNSRQWKGVDSAKVSKSRKFPGGTEAEWKRRYGTTADMVVVALDAATGAIRWRTCVPEDGPNITCEAAIRKDSKGASHLTMAAGDGRVFVKGTGGILRAFDARTGAPGWTAKVSGDKGDTDAVVFGNGVVATGAHGSRLVGLDAGTGKILWQVPAAGLNKASAFRWVRDGVVRFITPAGQCIDPRSGKVLWTVPDEIAQATTCDADHLVARGKGGGKGGKGAPVLQCFKIDPSGAKPLWTLKAQDKEGSRAVSPTIHRGHVYARIGVPFSKGRGDYQVVCLDLATGKILAGEPGSRSFSSPIAGDGLVFDCAASEVTLHPADPQRFLPGVKGVLRGSPEATAVYLDGRLFSRVFDGIVCYDLRGEGDLK